MKKISFSLLVLAKTTHPSVHGAVGSGFGAGISLIELGHWVVTAWVCRVCQGSGDSFPEVVFIGLSRVKKCEKEGRVLLEGCLERQLGLGVRGTQRWEKDLLFTYTFWVLCYLSVLSI